MRPTGLPLGERIAEAKPFPEMLSVITDPNLDVFQVTTDRDGAGNTRGGFFSPDGSRFFFSRHWTRGGLSGQVQYTMCEINDGFALRALTDDADPRSPVVSRDGRFFYYLANPPAEDSAAGVALKRVDLRTFRVETLAIRGFEWEPYSWRVGGTYFPGNNPAHRGHLLMGRNNRSQHWDTDGTYSEDPYIVTQHLVHPRSSWNGAFTENCQQVSPDLRTVFFNSDWTGTFGAPQVFAVRGFTFPEG